ncbi:universal stress protein [Salinisphaera sp. SPP-AMP-43]|uniref:universal stress protein n=1 Tax=Salinisphaera sp. SPP-AMP-43 TaxID=3121288 RepID=UPI003C6E9838
MSQTILVPIDLNQPAVLESVFQAVRRQAEIEPTQVVLLHVVIESYAGELPYLDVNAMERFAVQARVRLEQIATEQLGEEGNWQVNVELGPVARTIVRHADLVDADLIVMASHNPVIWDVFLGSTAAQVVKHARHSVLVIRQATSKIEPVEDLAETSEPTSMDS